MKIVISVAKSVAIVLLITMLFLTQKQLRTAQRQTQEAIADAQAFSNAYDKIKAVNAENVETARQCMDDYKKTLSDMTKMLPN